MLDKEENHQLRGLAGQLNWVCNQTPPDISFDSSHASMSLKNATIEDVFRANKVVAKTKVAVRKINIQEHWYHISIRNYCLQ